VTTRGHVAGSQRRTIENLREANAGLKARVEAVLALHHPTSTDGRYCTYCGRVMPCPTRRALEGKP